MTLKKSFEEMRKLRAKEEKILCGKDHESEKFGMGFGCQGEINAVL